MFDKPALTISQQINRLEERGLIIEDKTIAKHYLLNVSPKIILKALVKSLWYNFTTFIEYEFSNWLAKAKGTALDWKLRNSMKRSG